MRTIPLQDLVDRPELIKEVTEVLENGGLVCLPCSNTYRIVANLVDESAVNRLLQSKRRTAKAPSLVFVAHESMLHKVAADVDPVAQRLAAQWPRPITIQFEPSPDLPPKVAKLLSKANGKIGVRVPGNPTAVLLVKSFDAPLLVSSANREAKKGAHSVAQVKKNFGNMLDVLIDAGDLPPADASTVVDVRDGKAVVKRVGAVSAEEIERIVARP